MIFRKTISLFSTGALIFFAAFASAAESNQLNFFQLLTTEWELSEKNLTNLKNRIIVEELPVRENPREIAILAIVRINVPKAFLMKQLYGHDSIMLSENSSRSGIFGTPPSPQDMVSFQFPRSDLEVMRACKIGECKIKLPGYFIEESHRLRRSHSIKTGYATGCDGNHVEIHVVHL